MMMHDASVVGVGRLGHGGERKKKQGRESKEEGGYHFDIVCFTCPNRFSSFNRALLIIHHPESALPPAPPLFLTKNGGGQDPTILVPDQQTKYFPSPLPLLPHHQS